MKIRLYINKKHEILTREQYSKELQRYAEINVKTRKSFFESYLAKHYLFSEVFNLTDKEKRVIKRTCEKAYENYLQYSLAEARSHFSYFEIE